MGDVKERPILFSGDMVRAILDGRKTVTRRVVKPQPQTVRAAADHFTDGRYGFVNEDGRTVSCPYGVPGDILYVREAWSAYEVRGNADGMEYKEYPNIIYRADKTSRLILNDKVWKYVTDELKWRPSIHMPKWASRIMLEVTGVRVERVQDIEREDARREGVRPAQKMESFSGLHYESLVPYGDTEDARWIGPFAVLWDEINAKRGYGWDVNPWVWVVSFRMVQE